MDKEQKEITEEAQAAFIKDIEAVQEKHQLQIIAVLKRIDNQLQNTTYPALAVKEMVKKEEKSE